MAFDAVGTLLHPDPPAPVVYAHIGKKYGVRQDAQVLAGRFRTALHAEDEVDFLHGLQTSEEREVARWRAIVGAVLGDVEQPQECFRELFEHFSRPEAWRCDSGAAAVLGELRACGLRLAIGSNYDRRLRSVLSGTPALASVTRVVISSEVGWRKPAPEFFACLRTALDEEVGAILFVGDDPVNDCDGAIRHGLTALLLDPRGRHVDSGRRCIAMLPDVLDEIRVRNA